MDRRPRLTLHPLRMLAMTLPFRALRLPGMGISPGLRPLLVWGLQGLWVRAADSDRLRYALVRIFRRC